MTFEEYRDKGYLVVKLVPDFIVVHTGIQAGEPTIINTRIPTDTAAAVYSDNAEYFARAYEMDGRFGFAALCFEAGREYQHSRKLRKHINDALYVSAEKWLERFNRDEAELQRGAGI